MYFVGSKVTFNNPLGQESVTWYHHGPAQSPRSRIERDVMQYGLKYSSLEVVELEELILKTNEDLVVIR